MNNLIWVQRNWLAKHLFMDGHLWRQYVRHQLAALENMRIFSLCPISETCRTDIHIQGCRVLSFCENDLKSVAGHTSLGTAWAALKDDEGPERDPSMSPLNTDLELVSSREHEYVVCYCK